VIARFQVSYKPLFLLVALTLVVSEALFVIGVLAVILLAITGNATLRDFSIAVFNLLEPIALLFLLLSYIWWYTHSLVTMKSIVAKRPLTRRHTLTVAGYVAFLLVLTLCLPIVLLMVWYGIRDLDSGHTFVCELLYLCS